MIRSLDYIDRHFEDFFVCKECNAFNEINNDNCHTCGCRHFIAAESAVHEFIQEEIQHQINNNNESLETLDQINYTVS